MDEQQLEKLTIKNNYLFGTVMRDPKKCKPLLEKILGIKIKKIEYPELEKVIDHAIRAKGIRLDVYVEDDEHTVYNIEMQTSNQRYLPKRMRYYQGMIDLNIIKKGEEYSELKKSYIIFICDFDAFGKGRHIYTFENVCLEDSSIKLGDDTVKVVLNTKGVVDDVSDELKEILHYIGGDEPSSDYTRALENAVENVKSNEEWRREYMTLFLRDRENIWLGEAKSIVSQVRKKLSKGKSPIVIADEVERDVEYVENIISLIEEHPDMDDESIALELV